MGLIDSNPDTYLPRESGALHTIDHAHAEIHEGNHYTFTHTVSVGTGTAVSVMIQAPATGEVHLVFGLQANLAVTYIFEEGPTTTGGTAIVAHNNNRTSSTTSGTIVKHTVTYGTSLTILENGLLGTQGNPSSRSGGTGEARNEYILAASTRYGIKVTALNAATTVIVNGSFYVES